MGNKNRYFQAILQEKDFSVDQQYCTLKHACHHSGAIVTFTGLVRDLAKSNSNVASIELSIYEAMTQKQLQHIGNEVFTHFDIDGLDIIHRHGTLTPAEQIVYVGVASKHRSDAFSAAQMTMDYLKSKVAFWKKEHYTDNSKSRWIEPNQNDHNALKQWSKK